MGNLKIRRCPFCGEWMQFQFVGSHWKLGCLTRYCDGYCYFNGLNEEDIIQKLEKLKNLRKFKKEKGV